MSHGMIDTTTVSPIGRTRFERGRTSLSAVATPLALLVLGSASAWLYFWGRDLHRFTQWIAAYIGLFVGQLALYVLAWYAVQRWSAGSSRAAKWITIGLIILFAAAYRGVLVPQRPYLSSDVYRYVWDGRVEAAGMNPYRYVPEAPELVGLRDGTIYPNVNREDRSWLSPYPPVAQIVFFAVALIRPLNVTAFKAVISSFDLVTTLLLMLVLARSGLDPARAIIFAWHPLSVFESAHSGHIEAVYITFLVLALLAWSKGRSFLTGASLGLAAMVKLYPALMLPVFIVATRQAMNDDRTRRDSSVIARFSQSISGLLHKSNLMMLAAFVVTVVLAYAPYLPAGRNMFAFLRGYVVEEGFVNNGARYFLLEAVRKVVPIPTDFFLVVAAVFVVAVAVRWLLTVKLDARDVGRGAIALIGTYLMLTTPRYAWYYVWLIPFLCFAPRLGWLYLSSASTLLYLVWYTPLVYPGVPFWLGAAVFGPVTAMLAWDLLAVRFRARPAEPDRMAYSTVKSISCLIVASLSFFLTASLIVTSSV